MIELLFPTIERWHCIDLVLENMRLADKPETQILSVISGSDEYARYVEKKLKQIFKKVRIIRNEDGFIDHDQLRGEQRPATNPEKLLKVYRTYKLLKDNADPEADYYWFWEDDTLAPLNVFTRYLKIMDALDADIVSGQSYFWHSDTIKRNFWKINNQVSNGIGEKEPTEIKISLSNFPNADDGIIKLGATGLGNVLCKRECVLTWEPKAFEYLKSGADISFFLNAEKNKYSAYGIYSVFLPHITKWENGDIEIRGRIDKSLIPLCCPKKSISS